MLLTRLAFEERLVGHLYDIELSSGQRHTVETPHHHDDHHPDDFAQHLSDILKGAAGGVISGLVLHYTFRGRR